MERKKLLSLLLVVCMVLSLIPMVALVGTASADTVSATLLPGAPENGDRVVIHNTSYNKALGPCGSAGYYNKGVDATPVDGVLTGVNEEIIWDVTVTDDGNYKFSQGGKYISLGDNTYTSMPYDGAFQDWSIDEYGEGFSIKNIGRSLYMEWYASKNNFSAYSTISDNGMFTFRFFKVDSDAPGPDPTPDPTPTPEPTYTNMKLKREIVAGDKVVIYNPNGKVVMSTTDYFYNNQKHELAPLSAVLDSEGILAVPEGAALLTVEVETEGVYAFRTKDNRYLYVDGTHVQLVSEQGDNTLFQLEGSAGNYFVKCNTAAFNGNAQYLQYFHDYFTTYGMNANTERYLMNFYSADGEGAETFTVSFDANGGSGSMTDVTNATSPYELPANRFTAPTGKVFAGWKIQGEDTVYQPGQMINLDGNITLVAQWKAFEGKVFSLVASEDDLVAGGQYLIVNSGIAGEAKAMSLQKNNNRGAHTVTVAEDSTITLDNSIIAEEKGDEKVYMLTLGGDADGWSFFDPVYNGYLYAAGAEGGNYLRTQPTNDAFGMFTFTFDDAAIEAVSNGELDAPYLRYNSKSTLFSCYTKTSTIQDPIYLYKLDNGTAPEPKEPSFATQNLVLSGKIGLTFNMDLPEADNLDYTDSYMSFTIPHGTITERVDFDPNRKNRSATLYQFTCYVSTIQMAEPITATFHYKKDGASAEISKIYAVEEYFTSFDKQDADDPAQFSDQIKTLVKATADYGYFVQHYLGEHNTWTLGTDFKEFTKRYTESYSIDASVLDGKEIVRLNNAVDEIDKITYTLVLDSDTTIRVYFKLKTNYSGKFEAKLDSADYTAEKIGTRFAVEINNIAAHELCNSHHIEVTTEKGSAAVDVSALSYVCSMLAGYPGDATAQNAAWAIYSYAKAAEDLLN